MLMAITKTMLFVAVGNWNTQFPHDRNICIINLPIHQYKERTGAGMQMQ
jgi:hypothetical protein